MATPGTTILFLIGVGVWAFGVVGVLAGVQWVSIWFYMIVWWGYIVVADAMVRAKTGNSLLIERVGTFTILCLVSAFFWFAWETVNLRLHNWHYVGVAPQIWQRWPGAFIAYATVLPGVFETYELLKVYGLNWGRNCRPIPSGTAWYGYFVGTGILFLLLPLLWPKIFFPLVWGSLVFLLEPLNHRFGAKSLMRSWQRGDLSPFVRLLIAGLICGAFWESWNWLAEARWVYTIPYLAEPKLFAMPLAGYLGFPPFAVECYVFYASFSILLGNRGWEADDYQRTTRQPAPRWLLIILGIASILYGLWMCHMLDTHLIKGFAS